MILACLAFLGVSGTQAQNDVTKFLGIPVDGTVKEMKAKLKAKGFKEDNFGTGGLVGRFNGKDVNLFIGENNGKVFRITVSNSKTVSETDIRINYNNLCHQFNQNKKYVPLKEESDDIIPDGEDISYELSVHNKRYSANFFQIPTDTVAIQKSAMDIALSKYTIEQFQNPTPEQKKDILDIFTTVTTEVMTKKSVWFMICPLKDLYDQYYLTIFYDNGYNMSNGEDL